MNFSWGRAVLAGVVGTIFFDIAMYIDIALTGVNADIPAILGSKLLGESGGAMFFGHIAHFINGILLAIIFAAIAPFLPGKSSITKAVGFSVVETIFGVWLLVLPALGAGFAGIALAATMPVVTITRHIAYGIALGAIYKVDSSKVGSTQKVSQA